MLTNNYAALTAALEAHGPSGLHFRNSSDAHESAVLIPLVKEKDGSASLLFEVRSSRLDAQPGDICFPGGRMEEGETAEETAIRETAEELLVKPSQVSILGRLDGMMGPTGGAIWPVVGELKDYDGNFSKDEVGEVFKVPLDFFLNTEPERYGTTLVTVPDDDFPYDKINGGRNYGWGKKHQTMLFFEYKDRVIWGFTARAVWRFRKFLETIV
ncbi:MAG: CoA pyrophosphatase [Eubacterium sp.]|nr:CoA pyrophosphatase [Eubacterium sp.]